MRPNDYIASEDVMALTDTEYESLLNYIEFIGFYVFQSSKERDEDYSSWALLLDASGVLGWCHMSWLSDEKIRIPLEEVKRMAALGMVA